MSRRLLLPVLALALLPALSACGTSDPSTVVPPPGGAGPASLAPSGSAAAGGAVASGVPSDDAQQALSFTVAGGHVTGQTGRVTVKLGTKLRITVLSDVADELHVHVYDLRQEVSAGAPASLEFLADTPGVIEVELEHHKLTLTHLQVQ